MNKEDVKRLAGTPGLIPGIYNYCDRWCERCGFTDRCMNYAMEEDRGDDVGTRGVEDPEFWDEMSSVFDVTLDLLKESAEQYGIDIGALDLSDAEEEEERVRDAAENHPIATAAFAYIAMADQWLEDAQEFLEEKQSEMEQAARLDLPGSTPHDDAALLADALDIVSWYHTMIYPKMMRALGQSSMDGDIEEDEGFPKDSDGSAKVALISIDRSIGAWHILHQHLPGEADRILDMLVHLDRLRKAIENEFPAARAFQRVGFDYMPDEQEA